MVTWCPVNDPPPRCTCAQSRYPRNLKDDVVSSTRMIPYWTIMVFAPFRVGHIRFDLDLQVHLLFGISPNVILFLTGTVWTIALVLGYHETH